MGAWDNTLVVFLSDNGADATIMVRGDGHDKTAEPGSAHSFLCLGPGWATMSNAPFRRHKIWVHEGGISTPCIISWPARIVAAAPSLPAAAGDGRSERSEDTNAAALPGGPLRHTPAHIIDFVPTVLELTGVTPPKQWNESPRAGLPGKSLVPIFGADVQIPRDYLYWNHEGNHALRIGDWKIVAEKEKNATWELYDLKSDRIESHDLSAEQPARRDEMAARWRLIDEQYRRDSGQQEPRRGVKAASPAG
jgi:arylsulfatase